MMNVKLKNPNRWKLGIVSTAMVLVMTVMACNDELIGMVDSAQLVADIPTEIQTVMTDLSQQFPDVKFVYTEFDAPKAGQFDVAALGLNPQTIQYVQSYEERGKVGLVMAANEDFQKLVEYRTKDEVFDIVEDQPQPQGGMAEFYKFIGANMTYPAESRQNGKEGKIFVEFIVGKDGLLRDFKVLKGIDAACNAEAVRVLSMSPKWKSGMQRGEAVDVRMILPISFSLGNTDNGLKDKSQLIQDKNKSMEEMVIVGHSK